jgi:hypothetical protein
MLEFNTQRRADAHQCLQHKWIQTPRADLSEPHSHANNSKHQQQPQGSPLVNSTSSTENSDTSKRDDSSSSASEKMLSQSSLEQSIPMTKPRYYSESIISSHVYDYDSEKRRGETKQRSERNERNQHRSDNYENKKREKSSRNEESVDIYEAESRHLNQRHSHRAHH